MAQHISIANDVKRERAMLYQRSAAACFAKWELSVISLVSLTLENSNTQSHQDIEATSTKARQISVLPIVPRVAVWSVPELPLVIILGNLSDATF